MTAPDDPTKFVSCLLSFSLSSACLPRKQKLPTWFVRPKSRFAARRSHCGLGALHNDEDVEQCARLPYLL